MTKYCARCGAPNDDAANFCVSCGNPFTPQQQAQQPYQSATPQNQPQPTGGGAQYPGGAPQYQPQQSRAERALNIFGRNLSLVVPMVVYLIAEIVLGAIVAAVIIAAVLHGLPMGGGFLTVPLLVAGFSILRFATDLVFWLLLGLFVSVVAVEARCAVLSQPYSLGQAWGEVRSRFEQVVIVAVVLGVVNAVLGLVPFVGWLLEALAFTYFLLVEATMFVQNVPATTAFNTAFSWASSMLDRDGLTAVLVFVAALLSEIPIVNIFTVPYALLLATVFLVDSGVLAPTPPTAPVTAPQM